MYKLKCDRKMKAIYNKIQNRLNQGMGEEDKEIYPYKFVFKASGS